MSRALPGKSNPAYRHGYHKSPTYSSWCGARGRCLNPRDKKFPDYGGRGITFDSRWDNFVVFLKDMGERPLGTTLDRVDVNKGYSKDNCRWADPHTQGRNQRSNVWVEINGRVQCIADWCQELGLSKSTVCCRIRRHGWDPVRALITPPNSGGRNELG